MSLFVFYDDEWLHIESERLRVHTLKTHPQYFVDVKSGIKTFELRRNDRDYQIGDILYLLEYDPETKNFSGEFLVRRVSYVLKDCPHFGLMDGYVILGLKILPSCIKEGWNGYT